MFHEWNKPRGDTPFRASLSRTSRTSRKSESDKKVWTAAEANMTTFKGIKNTVAEIAQRLEKGRLERFRNSRVVIPLPRTNLKDRSSFMNHLQTDNPRPPPFPFLKRPIPPPFPLPTFDESITSLYPDLDEASEIPKITSIARDLSKPPKRDPRKDDVERMTVKPVETKLGKVNCTVNGHRQIPDLDQEVLSWKLHLRDLNLKHAKGLRPYRDPVPRSRLRSQQTSLTDVFGLTRLPKKGDSTAVREDEANSSNDKYDEDEYEFGITGTGNNPLEVRTVFKTSPKLATVPNRTLCNVELGIKRIENSKARIGNQSRLKKFF